MIRISALAQLKATAAPVAGDIETPARGRLICVAERVTEKRTAGFSAIAKGVHHSRASVHLTANGTPAAHEVKKLAK